MPHQMSYAIFTTSGWAVIDGPGSVGHNKGIATNSLGGVSVASAFI
jgi:hypothetical protein